MLFAAPSLFLANSAFDPAIDLQRRGVDTGTALVVGGISLVANAAGLRMPTAFGSALATRVATGAGASPSYLRRMRRRVQKEWGQDYWWKPGDKLPDRAPDLEAALGGIARWEGRGSSRPTWSF